MTMTAFAERVRVEQTVHSLLADHAWRLLRAAVTPDAVLAVTQRVRLRAREAALPTTIPFVRALGYEAEALCRSGRYSEALQVLREALSAGQQAGVLRYATATPAVHLFEYIDSPEELLTLADAFEREAAGAPHPTRGITRCSCVSSPPI